MLKPSSRLLAIDVYRTLLSIEPTVAGLDRYWPCDAWLNDGAFVPRVIFVSLENYLLYDGELDDPDRSFIAASSVARIRSSAERLPPFVANRALAEGEIAMGAVGMRLILRDGGHIDVLCGGVPDFVDLADWATPADVVDVQLAVPQAELFGPVRDLPYHYCVFEPPETER